MTRIKMPGEKVDGSPTPWNRRHIALKRICRSSSDCQAVHAGAGDCGMKPSHIELISSDS